MSSPRSAKAEKSGRRHVVIVGPTASGKSALALALAEHLHDRGEVAEIISVDSMQVYRGMDIGTASPTHDELDRVRHHLVNRLDPSQECSVAWFQQAAREALGDIEARGGRALFVGGTGLYHRAVIDGFDIPGQFPEVSVRLDGVETQELFERLVVADPAAAQKMEPTNRRRIQRALEVTLGSGRPFSSFGPGLEHYPHSLHRMVGLNMPRDQFAPRLASRLDDQLRAGFIDEVASLLMLQPSMSRTARQALGYRELIEHLEGRCRLEATLELIVTRTRQFAVRQERWFRRDPRIQWFDAETAPTPAELAGTLEAT